MARSRDLYRAVVVDDVEAVREHLFAGDRAAVRAAAVEAALTLAEEMVAGLPGSLS